MDETKDLRFTCTWRLENGEYCAYLVDDPQIAGYGATVKLAVDDLYMELLERTSACEIILDVVSATGDEDRLYIIEPRETSEIQGKASRLYVSRCTRCEKFGPRNYGEALDLKTSPKSECSYVTRRMTYVFSAAFCSALEELGLPFNAHPVTVAGAASPFFEMEARHFVRVPVPTRAQVEGSGGWTCSLCGFTSYLLKDIPTGLPGSYYVRGDEVPCLEDAFFLKRGSYPPEAAIKGRALEYLKSKGLCSGVGVKEVFSVTDSEASFAFSDFPIGEK